MKKKKQNPKLAGPTGVADLSCGGELPTVKETPEQKETRAQMAGEAIRKILEQYHANLVVTNLNIETGKIYPTIEVLARDLPL